MTNAYIVYVVIMESGCKITIFYLKIVMTKVYFFCFCFLEILQCLKYFGPKLQFKYQKSPFSPMEGFQKKILATFHGLLLVTIIFRPKMVILDTDSTLTC